MKAKLIPIGDSFALRIPEALIKQCGLGKTVQLRVEAGCLIVSSNLAAPDRKPRQGWSKAFRSAGSADDLLLFEESDPD